MSKAKNLVRRVLAGTTSWCTPLLAKIVLSNVAMTAKENRRAMFAKHGIHLLQKHYYSPIPEAEDLPADYFDRLSELPGVDINEDLCFQTMNDVAGFMNEFRKAFPIGRKKDDQSQFHLINGSYMAVDAHVYYGLIRQHKPKRIVEIGAGNSTLLSAAASLRNQEETGQPTELIAIEPYPWELFRKGHLGVTELIEKKVQDVDMSTFTSLEENDILFIDSSHVLRAGNDVQLEYLEILPRLASGVRVHIHDVSLPKAYPEVYFNEQLYWNEQDLLQAFLAFNSRFEVIWPGNYMMLKHPDRMMEVFPEIARMRQDFPSSEPTSFWIRSHN